MAGSTGFAYVFLIHMLIVCYVFNSFCDAEGSIGGKRQEIKLNADGGYDFLVAIHEDIKEDPELLSKFQGLIMGASKYLLNATDGRMYFNNVTIIVPSNWTEQADWAAAQGQSFSRARMTVAPGLSSFLEPVYTLQPGGCGQEGDFTQMTPDYIKTFGKLPAPFLDNDLYEKYGFDPFDSGDFSFVENLINVPKYIPGLVFYLSAMGKRHELYPNDDAKGGVFQHTLWSFFLKQIMGVPNSKEVGDRFEVYRVERQKDDFDAALSRRLINLHNNEVGRGLSLVFDISKITRGAFKLVVGAAKDCLLDQFKGDNYICGIIIPGRFYALKPLTMIEMLLVQIPRFLVRRVNPVKNAECLEELASMAKDISKCVFKDVAEGSYDAWVAASAREVQRAMVAGNTLSKMDPKFDDVTARDFDRKYLPIKYGAKEKRVVREWAHLRWGLYDENPRGSDPRFYNAGKIPKPTGCPRNIKGRVHDLYDKSQGCKVNTETGLPENCAFELDGSMDSTASLMYAEFLPGVTQFCKGGINVFGWFRVTTFTSDDHLHDPDSPNKQNRNCHQRSAEDVLSKHKDFASTDPGKKSAAPPTVFTIIQQKLLNNTKTVCMALDTSGSMGGDRITNLAKTVRNYITDYVQDGFSVGIVHFDSNAQTVAAIQEVTGPAVRSRLLQAVPTSAGGGTNIGDGLTTCQRNLRSYTNNSPAGTYILLLSDGESSVPSTVIPSLKNDGIAVNTIAYGQASGTVLDEISTGTGGSAYFAGDGNALSSITSALLTMTQQSSKDATVTISNQQVALSQAEPSRMQNVYLDSSIQNTRLSFTYSADIRVEVTMEDDSADVVITEDPANNRIIADINGTSTGKVEYNITSVNPSSTQEVTVTITSTPVDGEQLINIDARSDKQRISFDELAQVDFFVTVQKGVIPVSGLEVFATVNLPNTNTRVLIKMKDNGAGADSAADDGVYSGSLNANQFEGNGYYRWTVEISGSPFLKNISECIECGNNNGQKLSPITRSLEGGSINVQNWVRIINDKMPPDPVRDLKLLTAVDGSDMFTIGWTAAGDDPGQGTATGYEVAAYTDQEYVLNNTNLEPNYWVWTNSSDLDKEAGQPVKIQINTTELASIISSRSKRSLDDQNSTESVSNNTEIVYYIRLRALDRKNNSAPWSNIVSASFLKPEEFSKPIKLDGDKYEVYIPDEPTLGDILIVDMEVRENVTTQIVPADDGDHKVLINLGAVVGGSTGAAVVLFIIGLVIYLKKRQAK